MNKSDKTIERYGKYVMATYSQSLVLTKGKGTKVWDADGKVYLDFGSGISVTNLGHSHPRVVAAIQEQAAKLMHVSNLYFNENQAILGERLAAVGLSGKSFFCNSGAEANEALIKLARLWGSDKGKYEIITMKNSFHGRTLATASATGQDKVKKGFEPMPDGFVHADYNNLDSVKALINEKTVAVLVEAVQGEGGVIPADEDFLRGLRILCNEKQLLMLCDEIQCGLGRTGEWMAYKHYGLEPDAFSLAKGLGNGFPIGAICASPRLSNVFKPGHHASTFGGTPLACAAAIATLDVIEEERLVMKAGQSGELLREGLEMFVDKYEHVTEVRGKGLMLGLVMDQPVKPLLEAMRGIGLLGLAAGENVLRLMPPLNVKDDELEEALDMLDDALAEVHGVNEEPAKTEG